MSTNVEQSSAGYQAHTPHHRAYSSDYKNRTSIIMELVDAPGALYDVLKYFWKFDISITRIESRPSKMNALGEERFDFFLDFEGSRGDANVEKLISALEGFTTKVLIVDEKEVNWFPRHLSELDLIANRTLDAGEDLESDHPGFNDETYRARRTELAKVAR